MESHKEGNRLLIISHFMCLTWQIHFMDPYNLLQLADDTSILAEYYESLRKKFIVMLSYSNKKFQIPNIKKTYFAHFSENTVTTPMIIDNTRIYSIDEKNGHVYLGMAFLPTNNLRKIITFNIDNRMKHVKVYAWLEVNENIPVETKLLVLCFKCNSLWL